MKMIFLTWRFFFSLAAHTFRVFYLLVEILVLVYWYTYSMFAVVFKWFVKKAKLTKITSTRKRFFVTFSNSSKTQFTWQILLWQTNMRESIVKLIRWKYTGEQTKPFHYDELPRILNGEQPVLLQRKKSF